jgi:plastocyanin
MHQDMRDFFKKILFVFLLFNLLASVSYALPFNVVTKAGTQLPTTVSKGSTALAYYTVSNNTIASRNNNFVNYFPPNTSQVTGAGFCGQTFNLAGKGQAGDSCTLALQIKGAIDANDPERSHHLFVCFPGGKTCAGTLNPLNVQETPAKFLVSLSIAPLSADINQGASQQYIATGTYSDNTTASLTSAVTWRSSSSAAQINSAGLATGIAGGSTNITATFAGFTSNSAALNVNSPLVSIAILPATVSLTPGDTQQFTATGTYADSTTRDITASVTWSSSNPSSSMISASGLATSLVGGSTNITASLNSITSNTAVFTTTSALYLSRFINTGSMVSCLIDGGVVPQPCNAPTGPSSAGQSRLALNPAGTIIYSVTPNTINSVIYCNVSNGVVSTSCGISTIASHTGASIAINSQNTYAYIPYGTGVLYCEINQSTGALSNCNDAITGLTGLGVIALTPDDSAAYITANNQLTYCTINSTTHAFDSCTLLPNGFPGLFGVAVNPAGTYVYTAQTTGVATYCKILGDGTLDGCTQAINVGAQQIPSITFNYPGTYAYLTTLNSIIYCQVNNGGPALTNCITTNTGMLADGYFDVKIH